MVSVRVLFVSLSCLAGQPSSLWISLQPLAPTAVVAKLAILFLVWHIGITILILYNLFGRDKGYVRKEQELEKISENQDPQSRRDAEEGYLHWIPCVRLLP